MNTKTIAILALSLSAVACTGTMHMASVSEAFKKYEKQDYEATLKLVAQAESTGKMSEAQEAQLIYLKALAYDGLGDTGTANTLFAYVAEQHPQSHYAYLAAGRLSADGR